MLRLDMNLVFTVINLIVWYLLIKKFLVKPVSAVLEKRQAEIDKQMENAAAAEKEAGQLKVSYAEKLKESGVEAGRLVDQARTTAKSEADKIVADANTEAARIIAQARKEADAQMEKTSQDAKSQISSLVLLAAEKVLGEKAGSEENQKLVEQFLGQPGPENR